MPSEQHKAVHLKDYQPSAFLAPRIDLEVALAAHRTRVRCRMAIEPNPSAAGPATSLRLDGEHLELEDVRISGKSLARGDYEVTPAGLVIHRAPERAFKLETIAYTDPAANKALSGLYLSRGIYCTQCEAEGFRRITYCLDRPDVLSVYTTRIEAGEDEAPVLLSNGNLVESGKLKGGRHFALWQDPFPKPSYLFALVGGRLAHVEDTFTTRSGRKVTLRIYVEPGKEDRCGWAMDSLKRSMRWDERRFGLEYDLDIFMIVAVSDFNMGAMENKGLNIFNDKLVLASPQTATDANFEAIESVIAHEYFHNWTGNRITCRDWFQLCLKEGLTVFRDQEFSADERSRTVQRIADVRGLRAAQFPEDAGPLAHPVRPASYVEINNFYTATVYEKGAEVCRMIMTLVGRDGFRKGMDLYFERHDGEATTVERFVQCFEEANGIDLGQFMLWYSQSGTPELICSLDYDAKSKSATLTVEQSLPPTPGQPKKKPFHIPIRLGLIGGNGQDIDLQLDSGEPVRDGLVELKSARQTWRFVDVPSRPVASLLRGFSAPVNLTMDIPDRDLEFLMVHDSDLFNRWQAAQTYATRIIVEVVAAIRAGRRLKRGQRLAEALGLCLRDEGLEPAYRAQFIQLPSEADIAREIKSDVDPLAINQARHQVLRLIGKTLHADLREIYDNLAGKGRFRPDAASAGKRALRNAALALLVARGEPADLDLATRHFHEARNMTDQLAGLGLLADLDIPARSEALAAFERQWQDDLLVMDKWFAVQAMSELPGTAEEVERLTRHRLFSLANPNKVRALVGGFASANQVGFNRPDGAGYRLVADKVVELDAFNPQVAARLLGAFRSWRTLEAGRRNHARRALKKVAASEGLSRDVHDIVSRTLEG